jgi:hypothetical protein
VEKHLAMWTYWVGVACAAIALIMRGLNAVGLYLDFPGMNLGAMSFYKASFLFLAVAIATSVTLRAPQKE